MKKSWYQQKTTWTGLAAMFGAAGGFFMGALPLEGAVQIALPGLIGVFLRQGVEKNKTLEVHGRIDSASRR